MRRSIKILRRVPKHARGIIDTSVIIELDRLTADDLPEEISVAAISLAELASGPHATNDPVERARRQDRLQRFESGNLALPFDAAAARAYGRIYAMELAAGRKARGPRALDLLIAATALSRELPLYTRNPRDFASVDAILEIVPV